MHSKENILIIDDHESIRILLGRVLSKDYLVATKQDAFEALAWMRNGNIPDLIILDLDLPRLPGIEFLSNLRSSGLFHNIPVIILSGEEYETNFKLTEQLGISEYITKPFNPIELNNKIEKTLKTRRQIASLN